MLDPSPTVRPEPVRFEHAASGFGMGSASPRLSWRIPTAPEGFVQSAVELELTDEAGGVVTERVDTSEQVLVAWPFPPLGSRARASVRVRVAGSGRQRVERLERARRAGDHAARRRRLERPLRLAPHRGWNRAAGADRARRRGPAR